MGSIYFGEPIRSGNGRSSGSSRKGKKSSNTTSSDKPKQPQRGLGVAQLEKIRLSNEMGGFYLPSSLQVISHSTNLINEKDVTVEMEFSPPVPSSSSSSSYPSPSPFSFHPNIMMAGLGGMEMTNCIRYGTDQPPYSTGTARTGWNYNKRLLVPQQASQSSTVTRQFLTSLVEVEKLNRHFLENQQEMNEGCSSMGSSSQNSDSSDGKELDLDLKLSL